MVTFFGHRDTLREIQPKLEALLVNLIENYGADTFYVGNQGNFDYIVAKTLKGLKRNYPHINYSMFLPIFQKRKTNLMILIIQIQSILKDLKTHYPNSPYQNAIGG